MLNDWTLISGLAGVAASIVLVWIFLPRNGQEHPLTAKWYFSSLVIPLIMATGVLGVACVISALV